MENIIMLILGVFISVVGIVNIKGNISTIHSYNRRKVKEEDIPKYGKTVGTGTLIIGISLVLGFIVSFWSEIRSGDSGSYLLRCPLDGGTDCFVHCRKGEA